MAELIDQWVHSQAQSAYERGDAVTLNACVNYLVRESPNDDAVWTMQADALFQQQRWYEAKAWCESWLQQNKSNSACVWLGQIWAAVGLWDEADRLLSSLPPADADNNRLAQLRNLLNKALTSALRSSVGAQIAHAIDTFLAAQTANDDEAICLVGDYLLAHDIKEMTIYHALGWAHFRAQRFAPALRFLEQVSPADHDTLRALSTAQVKCGLFAQAQKSILLWAKQDHDGLASALLARCLLAQNNTATLDEVLITGIQQWPNNVELWDAVGRRLLSGSLPYTLRDLLRQQCQSPLQQSAAAWTALAIAEHRCGAELATVIALFEHATQQQGNAALAWKNLGACWFKMGDLKAAKHAFQMAIRLQGDYAMAWSELGVVHCKLGEISEANQCMIKAILLNQSELDAWNNLGANCLSTHYYLSALAVFDRILKCNGDFPNAHSNRCLALANIGRIREAMDTYSNVIEQYKNAHLTLPSNLLFIANYATHLSSEDIFALYRRVADSEFPPQRYFSWPVVCDPHKRLRIGYVSPDFVKHSCYNFMQPLLANHDHQTFEIVAYANVLNPDVITEELRGYCDEWRDVAGLSPEQIADLIRADHIDILVDFAGHTGGNLLNVFAMKPAPIQVTWMGYAYTTGLTQVDYFLCDEEMYPPGSESLFSEQALRVDVPSVVYKIPAGVPDVSVSPALQNGYVTFACLSRPIRINERCIAAWARILKSVAGSRLELNCHAFAENEMVELFRAKFAEHGIAAERLQIQSESPPWNVFNRVDIALDCFPHNSGTTLCEGLYMGVPFITRRDRVSMGRMGSVFARGVGHPEWIANDDDDYVQKAVQLATDIPVLAQLRQQLRTTMVASPLCDAKGFTHRVEQAFRQAWIGWCQQAPAIAGADDTSVLS